MQPKPKNQAAEVAHHVGDFVMGKVLPDAGAAMNAVFGAPQRAIAGAIGTKHPENPFAMAGDAVYGAFHPNDERVEGAAESRIGADHLKGHGDLADAAVDFAFQTVTDPLLYFGPGLATHILKPIGEAALGAFYRAAPKAEEFLRPDALVRRTLSPQDAATYEGIVERERSAHGKITEELRTAAEKYAKGEMNPQEAGEFERSMRARGIEVTQGPEQRLPAEVDTARKGLVSRNTPQPSRPGKTTTIQEPDRPVFGPQKGGVLPGKTRTVQGPAIAQTADKRLVGRRTSPTHTAPGDQIPMRAISPTLKRDPAALERLHSLISKSVEHQREASIERGVESEGLDYIQQHAGESTNVLSQTARFLSNLGKNALFINSIPHMGNVGVLTWLHGGEAALAGGVKRFLDPSFYRKAAQGGDEVKRLEQFGGTSHFSAAQRMGVDLIPGIGPAFAATRGAMQGMLDRWETAMRSSRFEQLLGKTPNPTSKDLYWAAAQVRRELGDYTNTSGLTRMLSDTFGAPFPQWRLVSVPQSIGKAALTNPQRLAQYYRGQNVINQDVFGKKPYEVEPGKPPDDAAIALTAPGRYATSPSTLGVLGTGIQYAMHPPKGPELLEELAGQYLPGANLVEPLIGASPFKSQAPLSLNELLSIFGAHTKKRPVPAAPPPVTYPTQ